MKTLKFAITNGTFLASDVTVSGTNDSTTHNVYVAFTQANSGTVAIQYKIAGSNNWQPMGKVDLTDTEVATFKVSGVITDWRFVVAGASGTGSIEVTDSEKLEDIHPLSFYGETGGMSPAEIGEAIAGTGRFSVSASGLIVRVGAFSYQCSLTKNIVSFGGGSVVMPDDSERFIFINPASGEIHLLDRDFSNSDLKICKAVSSGGTVTISDVCRIGGLLSRNSKFIKKLYAGEPVSVAAIGSSLTEGAGSTPAWYSLLFDASTAAEGYNIHNVANVSFSNYGIGGSDALYGYSMLGRSFIGGGNQYLNTAWMTDKKRLSRVTNSSTIESASEEFGRDSSIFGFDLVIIGLLANGGYNQRDYYDAAIRRLVTNGVEVVIHTDNSSTDSTDIYDAGVWVSEIAEKYGCALVDTAAYIKEAVSNGENPYQDTIHQNVLGHRLWAEALLPSISGVFNGGLSIKTNRTDTVPHSKFPSIPEVCFNIFDFTKTRITRTAGGYTGGWTSRYGLASSYVSRTPADADIRVGHCASYGMFLVIDGSSLFTADVTSGASVVATIDHSTAANKPRTIDVFKSYEDTATFPAGVEVSQSLRITVTSGEMKLLAVGFYAPDYDDITSGILSSTAELRGSPTVGGDFAKGLYVNTLNDALSASCEKCRRISVVAQRSPSAGVVSIVSDDGKTSIDLYTTASENLYMNGAGGTVSDRTVKAIYTGDNASIAAETASSFRLMLINAIAIFDR